MLTREEVRAVRHLVTVAPVTSTVRGLSSEVVLGAANGPDHDCAANLDAIATIDTSLLIRPLGALLEPQEALLTRASHDAFDLDD